jgi:transposase
MHYLRDLVYRLRQGESERAIARDLGLSRMTVRKYHARAERAGYLAPKATLPSAEVLTTTLGAMSEAPRTASGVEPYATVVAELLAQRVEVMTIFDRLHDDHGYRGSYSSVRRYVQRMHPRPARVTVRVHTGPGEEAQIDFGAAGPFVDPASGRARSAWVFVMTLGYSRHQYAELVFDQTVRTWIACHRQAFAWFGGMPRRLVLDNLKAAVLEAALHDPVLGEAYRRMAQHYGVVVSPTRPRTPEHKGKVESGVHFVKRSFLAGHAYADLRVANEALRRWIVERAGTREHGTTHEAPLALFEAHERAALLPLPVEPFELRETRSVKVHPDCHVVIDGSYYSVPYAQVGATLDAFVGERVVELFRGTELIATHPRATRKGSWQTRMEHYPAQKAAFLERTPQFCRSLAERIGPATSEVVGQLLADRPLDRLRSVQGILGLVETTGRTRLEAACRRALAFGDPRYRRIKEILNAGLDEAPLPEGAEIVTGAAPTGDPAESPATSTTTLPTTAPTYTFERTAAELFPEDVLVTAAAATTAPAEVGR